MTDHELVEAITAVRVKNNTLWMSLLKIALHHAPTETKTILGQITANDLKVSELTQELSRRK